MRSLYLFLIAMIVTPQLFAEGNNEAMTTAGPSVGGQFPHFGAQVSNSNGGGGGIPAKVSLRLIGRTYAVHNGTSFVPVDSFSYAYSNDRGGIPNNDQLDNDESLMYDESVKYIFDIGAGNYRNVLRRKQDFYPNNKVQFFTYANWKPADAKWLDSARYSYTYDNQKMVSTVFQRWGSGMWSWNITSDLKYSGQNVVAMESPVYKISFDYDGNNNITQMYDEENIGGQWFKKEKHTYDYNGNNVIRHTLWVWNSLANDWREKKEWEYTYSGTLVTLEKEYKWDGGMRVPVTRHTYTFDGNKNMITDIEEMWSQGTFVNESLTEWIYNGQDLPEVVTTRSWVNGSWLSTTDDKQYRFYYQNYFPASVKAVVFDSEVRLYPIPASNMLTVDINWDQPEQFTVSLIDVKGSVLQSWKEQPTSSYRNQIDVSQLPNANYFITVTGESVKSTKRIVVSH